MFFSSANAKKWEIELATLKSNNARLTSALQESTANVDEWKRQLQCYKEENMRMKAKYQSDLENSKGENDSYVFFCISYPVKNFLRNQTLTKKMRINKIQQRNDRTNFHILLYIESNCSGYNIIRLNHF